MTCIGTTASELERETSANAPALLRPLRLRQPACGAQPLVRGVRGPLELTEAVDARRMRAMQACAIEREAVAVVARLRFDLGQARGGHHARWSERRQLRQALSSAS